MKKRILSILAALCLALALLPSTAWGTEMTEADLRAAIEGATADGTVQLTGDVTLTEALSIDKALTLDLNSYNITQAGTRNVLVCDDCGSLFFDTDLASCTDCSETLRPEVTGYNAIDLSDGANLTIIGDGTIKGSYNGVYVHGGATLTVNNCKITTTLFCGIYNNGAVIIKSGTVTGGEDYDALYSYGGAVTIEGGTLGAVSLEESSTAAIKGGTIASFYLYDSSATISGGTFKSFLSGEVDSVIYADDNGKNVVFKISSSSSDVTIPAAFKGKIIFENANLDIGKNRVHKFLGGTYEGTVSTIETYNLSEVGGINGAISFGISTTLSSELLNSINTAMSKRPSLVGNFLQKDATGNWLFSVVDTVSITAKASDTPEISSISFNDTTSATPKNGIQKTLIKDANVTLSYTGLADSHYEFKGWYVGDVRKSTANPYAFSAGETATYVATFGLLPSIQAAKGGAESWYNTHASGGIVSIGTIEEMNYFAMAVASGKDFAGKTVKLTADLNYSGKEFFVIGDATHPFKGVFDGGNHTIRNISADKIIRPLSNDPYTALFAKLNRATVQNLKLQDSDFSQSTGYQNYSGGIAADATNSTVKNCTLSNVSTDAWFNSPVVAHTGGGITLENITATNCTPGSGKGGTLLGYSDGATIKNVVVDGVKSYDGANSGAALIGHANSGSNTVENATVNAPNASLIGSNYVQDSAGTVTITGNDTSITAKNVADTTAPDKSIAIEKGNLSVSQPTTINGGTLSLGKETEITVANGNTFATLNAGSKIVTDDGSTEVTVASSGEGAVDKHGNLILPAGSTISTGNESGSVTVSNSAVVTPNGTVVEGTSSAAPTINSNGSVTIPSGGTVTKADGTSQTLQNGGSVASDSNSSDVVTPNNSRHYAKLPTPTGKIESPATADLGVVTYAALAFGSLLGLGYTSKKR